MIDIHTHLYFPQYDTDRDETIKRAFDAGLTMMISVSTEPDDHAKALAIANLDDRIFVSVGLHPHYFNAHVGSRENFEQDIEELHELTKSNPKIIAIGECGLDYYSHTDNPISQEQKQFQKEGFEKQIQLAQDLNLPMIIHCRDAYEDIADIIRDSGNDTIFILHCYMGNTEVTKRLLELPNVYFSFTGNITYPVKKILEGTRDDIHETVKMIPLERTLTETDCPFLAPVPYRGKRNEPSFVSEVVKKIAELHGVSVDDVVKETIQNKKTIFHF